MSEPAAPTSSAALKRTPFHDFHLSAGARMVEFAGWERPLVYSGIVQEHHQCRNSGAFFDVSHMGRLRFAGKDAENNKPTYVSILGRGQARDLAEGLRRDAYQALEGFGEKADRLRQVTDFIIQREF